MIPDILAMIGRMAMAAFFIWEGLEKLLDQAGTLRSFSAVTLPVSLPVIVVFYFAIIIELVGGLLLLFGFAARSVGIILAAWCVATGLLYVAAYGPGAQAIRGTRRYI